ncbi:hypothetical protein [Tepidibacter aestuarii]|uniref:hypothetical protein n=1 Tax=Tepidibacter aestuarii TaxID=2925782 RepID=UPI0020C0D19B|nr:hypothetical protein [Tepidibacter aestuarii]CAH2212660.1 conserved exported protein of unknown function [Tepidibacter aestuarii]
MNLLKKIFFCTLMFAIIAVGVGCTQADNEVEQDTGKKTYSNELASYFPSVEGTVLNYSGTAEYGQGLTLNKVVDNNESLMLNFKGEILDISEGEGPSKEDRIIETEYIINKDTVTQTQKNLTRRFSQSIITEQIVLKLPMKVGNTWDQKITIDGKEYTAKTKITDVSKDDRNRNMIKTETTIQGIENYTENTYREIKVFKEGKGLVEFRNTILLGESKSPFEFGYILFEPEQ